MSYEEAFYLKQKHKQMGQQKMEEKMKRLEQAGMYVPNTSTTVASDNITFGKKHKESMYEALKKVNPEKWR